MLLETVLTDTKQVENAFKPLNGYPLVYVFPNKVTFVKAGLGIWLLKLNQAPRYLRFRSVVKLVSANRFLFITVLHVMLKQCS